MFDMISKLFWQIFLSIILILTAIFSVMNTDKVAIDYIFGTADVSLAVLLTSFFVVGLLIGSFITKFIQITKTTGGASKK